MPLRKGQHITTTLNRIPEALINHELLSTDAT
jgi:hypothetical protein